MISFRTWLEEHDDFDAEAGPHIKVPLPSVKQSSNYDCGAAALRAIAEHFKVGPDKESDFIKACKTTKEDGTDPKAIIRAAHAFGLNTKPKSGMSIKELQSYLDMGRPIMCLIQAYGEPEKYDEKVSGHYVNAIGYDESNIYFEDPSMKGSRGMLPFKEFQKRWHDKGEGNTNYIRYGIVIWKQSDEGTDREYLPQAKKIP